MNPKALIKLPSSTYNDLWAHLQPKNPKYEEVAFVYAHQESIDGSQIFHCSEWFAVPPTGFESRSKYHLELSDETRASVIKRAHELSATLIEFHSHIGPWPARFSISDLLGFEEFVPHVLWRLKSRPYLAVVVAKSGFDGFVWQYDANNPDYIEGIIIEDKILKTTKLSPLRLKEDERTL